MSKLSKPMQRVVDLMAAGWEFCFYPGYSATAHLQKDGCGRGGEVEEVHLSTFGSLRKRGLIKCFESKYPRDRYELTKTGRELANAPDPTPSES